MTASRSGSTLLLLALGVGALGAASSPVQISGDRGLELRPGRAGLRPIPLPAINELDRQARDLIVEGEEWVRGLEPEDPDLGIAYGFLGRVYLAQNLVESAVPAFFNAASVDPETFRWQYFLGYTALQVGDLETAQEAFRSALTLEPENVMSLVRLGVVLHRLDDVEEAKRVLRKAVDLDSNQAYAYAVLGNVSLQSQNFAAAIDFFERALELQPTANSLYNPLAQAYRRQGHRDRAEELLRLRGPTKVATADPLLQDVEQMAVGSHLLLHRGSVAIVQGRVDAALEAFRGAVEADPQNPIAHHNLGAVLIQVGQEEAGLAELREAVRLDPDYSKARMSLGTALSRGGRSDEAIIHLRAALILEPENLAIRQNLANVLRRSGDCARAVGYYRSIREKDPTIVAGWLGEGLCQANLQNYQEAYRVFESALEVVPGDPRLREAVVRILAASPVASLRDGARAVQIGERVLADTGSLSAAEALAMAYAEAERFPDAVQMQRQAVEAASRSGMKKVLLVLGQHLVLYEEGSPCRQPWPPPR